MKLDERRLGGGRARRARRGHHPLRHRRDVRRRQVGGVPRRRARARGATRSSSPASSCPGPKDEPYAPGALARRDRRGRARAACAASAPTTSTSTTSTTPTPMRPSTRRSRRSTSWCAQGKVLHVASSNVDAEQIAEAATRSAGRGLAPASAAPRSSGTCCPRGVEERGRARRRRAAARASSRTSRWRPACSPASTGGASRVPRGLALRRHRRTSRAMPPTRTSTRVERLTDVRRGARPHASSSWRSPGSPLRTAWRR